MVNRNALDFVYGWLLTWFEGLVNCGGVTTLRTVVTVRSPKLISGERLIGE
jgi:hypothetical protein